MASYYTQDTHFYGNTDPEALIKQFGSPLYVYNEAILRKRTQEMVHLVDLEVVKIRL